MGSSILDNRLSIKSMLLNPHLHFSLSSNLPFIRGMLRKNQSLVFIKRYGEGGEKSPAGILLIVHAPFHSQPGY